MGFCKEGEGDCDSDHECEGSLVCGEGNCAWGDSDDCCRLVSLPSYAGANVIFSTLQEVALNQRRICNVLVAGSPKEMRGRAANLTTIALVISFVATTASAAIHAMVQTPAAVRGSRDTARRGRATVTATRSARETSSVEPTTVPGGALRMTAAHLRDGMDGEMSLKSGCQIYNQVLIVFSLNLPLSCSTSQSLLSFFSSHMQAAAVN